MPWYYAVAERDHDIQNPTSRDKIRLLGELLRLGPDTNVLDIACEIKPHQATLVPERREERKGEHYAPGTRREKRE